MDKSISTQRVRGVNGHLIHIYMECTDQFYDHVTDVRDVIFRRIGRKPIVQDDQMPPARTCLHGRRAPAMISYVVKLLLKTASNG
jgi:hypothetical protein